MREDSENIHMTKIQQNFITDIKYDRCTISIWRISFLSTTFSIKFCCKIFFQFIFVNYVGSFVTQGDDGILKIVKNSVEITTSDVLCLGLKDTKIGTHGSSSLLNWALWGNCPRDLLLTPGHANVKPPNFSFINWTTVIYFELHGEENLLNIYQKSLKFLRPGDFVVFIISVGKRISLGDNRLYTRFEFGRRLDWSAGPSLKSLPFYSNDDDLEVLIDNIRNLLIQSKLEGVVRVEYDVQATTRAQLLCKASIDERADLIVIKQNQDVKNLIIECIQECTCSVAILK